VSGDEFDQERPLDPRDYSRRTLLAVERTYLAWWRTGLTALAVALATARVVPGLSRRAPVQWPYTLLGVGFAVLGMVCIGYGEKRRRSVSQAVRRGEFDETDPTLTIVLTAGGLVLAAGLVVLLAIGP
jgi:putative membrane protein